MCRTGTASSRVRGSLSEKRRGWLRLLAAAAVASGSGPAAAHTVSSVSAVLDLRSDGTSSVELSFNLTQQLQDSVGPLEAAERFVREHLVFRLDGREVEFAGRETVLVEGGEAGLSQTHVTVVLRPARTEPGNHYWIVELGKESPAFLAGAVVRDGATERRARVLIAGEDSGEIPWTVAGDEAPASSARAAAPAEPPLGETFLSCLKLGFQHILPLGLDHILFVLGLFFSNRGWKSLLIQVTAFTVAHSLTLALAAVDLVRIAPGIVEPLIAVSIVWVAIENLLNKKNKRDTQTRIAVVFGLGLVHGLGFAGILRELGLSGGQLAAGLVSFNIGVELGQLAVLGLAALAVAPVRGKEWYARAVVTPACLAIAAVGLFWTFERVVLA
ncbi:MAG TPA: HupE/UreJ family protein [Verrucomicrobiales bacterium]|nr:HupE/UreJ family protein [Verrucomicrobiales bacterium]